MLTALFRLAPIEGTVTIDDINYSTLGLHDLRRKISIIPQEPVLFSASLRYNLDPFNEFEDAALFEALQEVCFIFKPSINNFLSIDSNTNSCHFLEIKNNIFLVIYDYLIFQLYYVKCCFWKFHCH